ncbi:HNH endonuclease [Afifella sp. IM 167]|nr:HNH endonuclease [Afifella sp. IM 167]
MPSPGEFRDELSAQVKRATEQGRPHMEVNAGELHRKIGGYPPESGKQHSMPSCCNVMREEFRKGNAEIVFETDSGQSASFTVRYMLPR